MSDDPLSYAPHAVGYLSAAGAAISAVLTGRHAPRIRKLEANLERIQEQLAELQTKEDAINGRREILDELSDTRSDIRQLASTLLNHRPYGQP